MPEKSWRRGLRVRGKPKWNFHVEKCEQRDIPIPDDSQSESGGCFDGGLIRRSMHFRAVCGNPIHAGIWRHTSIE
jgi:hypothetical protein